MNNLTKSVKKLFLLQIVTLSVFSTNLFAQSEEKGLKYSGFSGGMLVHSGYVQSKTFTLTGTDNFSKELKLSGVALGIGGQVRFNFGKHLRIGTEGYVTEHPYSNKSYVSIGWGGVLADCIWSFGKVMPFAGGTFGGGSQKNVTILGKVENDFMLEQNNISFRKFGFLCVVPFAGVEFALSHKIHIVLKVDYIANISNPQPDFVTGARVYAGFSFCR